MQNQFGHLLYVYIKIRAYSKVWVINNNNNSIAAYVIAAVEASVVENCRERKRRLEENKACLYKFCCIYKLKEREREREWEKDYNEYSIATRT